MVLPLAAALGVVGGGALLGGLGSGISTHQQNIKKQQAEDKRTNYLKNLFGDLQTKGTKSIEQGRTRSLESLQQLLTGERGQLQGLFEAIRKEARGATGRLGTLGGTPEQNLVEPQVSRLSTQFGNRAQNLTLGIEQQAQQQQLQLLQAVTQGLTGAAPSGIPEQP